MEPTILVNVPTSSDAYKEEIFGPVVIVNTFKDEAGALAEANSTEFGLFCECAYGGIGDIANMVQHLCTLVTLRELSVLQESWNQEPLVSTALFPYEHSICPLADGSSQE